MTAGARRRLGDVSATANELGCKQKRPGGHLSDSKRAEAKGRRCAQDLQGCSGAPSLSPPVVPDPQLFQATPTHALSSSPSTGPSVRTKVSSVTVTCAALLAVPTAWKDWISWRRRWKETSGHEQYPGGLWDASCSSFDADLREGDDGS